MSERVNKDSSIKDLDINYKCGTLIKTTLVDYPALVATTFFLSGCNLRCPYCYNAPLVLPPCSPNSANNESNNSPSISNNLTPPPLVSINDLFKHLEKRRKVLQGLVLSGGEALLNPALPTIITYAKSLGYKVKLDTNGTLPASLNAIISDKNTRPDYLALDIKTSPSKYNMLLSKNSNKENEVSLSHSLEDKIIESIKIASTYPAGEREFRTVLVPTLIKKEDILNISRYLPKNALWLFTQFIQGSCLNPSYNLLSPYKDSQISALVSYAKTLITGAALR